MQALDTLQLNQINFILHYANITGIRAYVSLIDSLCDVRDKLKFKIYPTCQIVLKLCIAKQDENRIK